MTHITESVSPHTGPFVFKHKRVCIVVLCKCGCPHKTTAFLFVCLFIYIVDVTVDDFPILYSNCDFACVQEYICPRCDSGFIEEVTEDSR